MNAIEATPDLLDTLVTRFPGWGFSVLLLLAFLISSVLAGYGLRAIGGLAGRAAGRRL